MSGPRAKDLGYIAEGFTDFQADKEWDIVPVGYKTKGGDYYIVQGEWAPLPDKYVGFVIEETWRPVERRRRWDCHHIRELGDKFCPVCMVFHRYVPKYW